MDPGAIIEGRFEIERKAGEGGMGVVFRALDHEGGAPVAIKVLHGDNAIEIERFGREAAVLAALRHPGIVRYITHGITSAGERYLVMEWLEGEDLSRHFARRRLAPPEILALMREVADALSLAHQSGVVHRDIKPSNIFLVGTHIERAKVIDFGIAHLDDEAQRLTQSGALMGTPNYMAPEQARGSADIGASTDVFSLGCVFFEAVIGKPAFDGAHAMAVLTKILLQQVTPLRKLRPDVPEPVERLIARMLAKEPTDRPRDAVEVAAELAALGDLGGEWASPLAHLGPTSALPLSPPSSSPSALTQSEQRLVSVILASPSDAGGGSALALERYGGRSDILDDGSMLVTIQGAGNPADRAVRAARCALTIRARFSEAPVCVVTGRGVVSARTARGEVIERGVRALRAARPGVVQLDTMTAEMLGERFVIGSEEGALTLSAERVVLETPPLLLGRPTQHVGRSRELATLEGVFSGCAAESVSSTVLVTGPTGMGKSRLRWEFIEKLRRADAPAEILSGRAESLGESSPFGSIADAICGAAGIRHGEPLEVRRRKLAERLGRRLTGAPLARATAFLGELSGIVSPDEDDEALRAARHNPMLMGDAMQLAWEDWLSAECARGPVVLVLDDLHWADTATVRLIGATLRKLRDLPLMVLALARPEVHARFPGLWAEREVQTVRLGPLSRKLSEQLVRDAIGERAGDAVVARIAERADGNPFYLEELIRAVVAGRGDALPDSVVGMVEARLDAEGSIAKRVLRAASIFGGRFSKGGVAALLGGDQHLEEVSAWLEALVARELIVPAPDRGPGEDRGFVFRHAFVQAAAYGMLTEDDRSLGHRLAGAWLEERGDADAAAMAEHFCRGAP